MKHIEKLSYKYINTYGRFSQHRKSEEPIIDKINEIIDILQNKGLCKLKDKNVSQLIEIVKLNEEIDRLNNIISQIETLVINHNCDTGDIYYKYNGKYLKSELKERIIELVELKEDNK